MTNKFEIDFFDLMFLSESVIPKKPIARSVCFDSFSSVHYHKMSKEQRKQFFEHVTKCYGFDVSKEQCAHFYARFNPKNQFLVTTTKGTEHECYFYNGEYHVSQNSWIDRDYITKIVRVFDGKEFQT